MGLKWRTEEAAGPCCGLLDDGEAVEGVGAERVDELADLRMGAEACHPRPELSGAVLLHHLSWLHDPCRGGRFEPVLTLG